MFSLTVTRACGHQEKVTADGLPPGKKFNAALDLFEKAESQKLCGKCSEEYAASRPKHPCLDNIVVIVVWLITFLFIAVIGTALRR